MTAPKAGPPLRHLTWCAQPAARTLLALAIAISALLPSAQGNAQPTGTPRSRAAGSATPTAASRSVPTVGAPTVATAAASPAATASLARTPSTATPPT